jgi:hypothetical protein
MKLPFATLLLLLFPLAGAAQTLPSLAPQNAPLVEQLLALDASGEPALAQGASVLPIWSGSNGRLLAVVALPPGWTNSPIDATPAYAGPSAWHLAGSRIASAGGLRWQLGGGVHADALFGQYLSGLPSACTASNCDMTEAARRSRGSMTGMLGLGWTAAGGGLDLSYGLSWLQAQGSPGTFRNLALDSALVPVLTFPGAQPFALDSETSLFARGRWQPEQGPALDVAAAYGRGRASPLGDLAAATVPGIDLDQLSLSLGLDAGSLRGAIVGHVLSSDDPAFAGKRWTTLDLGVSWRTPWSGVLSVGAQTLWSAPVNSARDADASQARTPYIQYRQDL